jgi:hypothetical protein
MLPNWLSASLKTTVDIKLIGPDPGHQSEARVRHHPCDLSSTSTLQAPISKRLKGKVERTACSPPSMSIET